VNTTDFYFCQLYYTLLGSCLSSGTVFGVRSQSTVWWAERHTVVSTRELGPKLVQAGGKSGSEFRYPRHGRMRASICGRGSHRHGGVAATCGQRCVLSWDLGWDGETGAGTLGLHGRGGLGRPAASSAERARARGGRSNMRRCVHEPFTNVHERSRTFTNAPRPRLGFTINWGFQNSTK
jgi:hypothetical protein